LVYGWVTLACRGRVAQTPAESASFGDSPLAATRSRFEGDSEGSGQDTKCLGTSASNSSHALGVSGGRVGGLTGGLGAVEPQSDPTDSAVIEGWRSELHYSASGCTCSIPLCARSIRS